MWIVRRGLAGRGISFQDPVTRRFLRQRRFEVWADPEVNTVVYKKDASFTVEKGAERGVITLKSVSYPHFALRQNAFKLYISRSDRTALFKKDSSFVVMPVE